MTDPWMTEPVGVIGSALFGVVVLVHLGHAVMMKGSHRRWHLGHVLMAAGMVVMFLPTRGGMLLAPALGSAVFAAAAGILAALLAIARIRGHRIGRLWLISVIDLAWMAYMFMVMSTPMLWLSVLGALWFAAQSLGWAGGWLGRALEHGGLGDEPASHPAGPLAVERVGARVGTAADANNLRDSVANNLRDSVADDLRDRVVGDRVVDGGRRDWSVRVTLVVMAVGMVYMLLATQLGMGAAGMGGMAGR